MRIDQFTISHIKCLHFKTKLCECFAGYSFYNLGQNLGYDQDSWDAMIQFWFDENVNYEMFINGTGSNNGEPVQHYKQVNQSILIINH